MSHGVRRHGDLDEVGCDHAIETRADNVVCALPLQISSVGQ
jgi:hypothetical protein